MIFKNEYSSSMSILSLNTQEHHLDKYIQTLAMLLRSPRKAREFFLKNSHEKFSNDPSRKRDQRRSIPTEESKKESATSGRRLNRSTPSCDSDLTSARSSRQVLPKSGNHSDHTRLNYTADVMKRDSTELSYSSSKSFYPSFIATSSTFSQSSPIPEFPQRKRRHNSAVLHKRESRWSVTFLYYLLAMGLIFMCDDISCFGYPAIPEMNTDMQSSTSSKKLFSAPGELFKSSWFDDESAPSLESRRHKRATKRGVPPYLTKHGSLQRLMSRNDYFLEILKNGRVRGTRNKDSSYGIFRLESVSVGVVAIRGNKSGLFLAMNKRGHLYGAKNFTDECKFYEKMPDGRYFNYEAVPKVHKKKKKNKKNRHMFVGFDRKGQMRKGHRIRGNNRGALFNKISAS